MAGFNEPHEAEQVPDRFELFLLSDEEKKVTWQFDTRASFFSFVLPLPNPRTLSTLPPAARIQSANQIC